MPMLSASMAARVGEASFRFDIRILALVALIVLCTMDFVQLVFAVVGAITYALIQTLAPPSRRLKLPADVVSASRGASATSRSGKGGNLRSSATAADATWHLASPQVVAGDSPATTSGKAASGCGSSGGAAGGSGGTGLLRQPSSRPVAPPVFKAVGWNAEVDELLTKILPTAESSKAVQGLVRFAKQTLLPVVPEAEVLGFASGDFSCGTAFRVAVPEVDLVICAKSSILSARLRGRDPQHVGPSRTPNIPKLQKSAIRTFTDRLVATGHVKFRRSAFRGSEPKVTLLVTQSLGIHDEAIPIDLSVNSMIPLHNAAVLAECGHLDPRAKALALLVRRWAKDRGVSHVAKGHLSPYAWTLLTMYFMQVGAGDDDGGEIKGAGSPLLPPLQDMNLSLSLACGSPGNGSIDAKPELSASRDGLSVGQMFKKFARFYCEDFDFRREAVCVRRGKRAPPDLSLPLHIVLHEDGVNTSVAPSIEDPFDRRRNLGAETTAASLQRMREELSRAHQLCVSGASLAEVLEPWAPAEHCDGEVADDMMEQESF